MESMGSFNGHHENDIFHQFFAMAQKNGGVKNDYMCKYEISMYRNIVPNLCTIV